LEQACKEGADEADMLAALDHTVAALAPLIQALAPLDAAPAPSDASSAEIDPAKRARLQSLSSALRDMLADSDADAVDLMRTLAHEAEGLGLDEVIRPVADALAAFNFDAALAAADALQTRLHPPGVPE
jgi:hypothetical protein